MSLSIPSAMSASDNWALANSTPSYLAPSEEEVAASLVRSGRSNDDLLDSSSPPAMMCLSLMELSDREIISERIHGSSPEDSYDHTRVPASILDLDGWYYCWSQMVLVG